MTAQNNERSPLIIPYVLGAQGAGTVPFIWCSRKFRILAVRLINNANLAQDATNFVTVQLRRGNEIVAEWATATDGGITAGAGRSLRVLDPVMLAGTQLSIVVATGGTGALTGAFLQVEGFFV